MRPLRLGHRGRRPASRSRRTGGARARRSPEPAPLENTLAAFEAALDAGCDGFELDLRRTLDGRIVVHHDPRLAGLPVARTPYETLRRQEPRLTTLDDVLARFSRRAWIDIEVKSPGLEPELAAQLRRRPVTAGCVISSFQPRILLRLAACGIGPLCLNLRRPRPLLRLRRFPPERVPWIAPHERLCSAGYVRRLRRAGWRVLVWTVNRPRKMRALAEAGADAIVSDDPTLLVATLRPDGRWE